MTTHTYPPRHHRVSGRSATLGLAATALAAVVGYGVFTWVTDDPVATAPAQDLPTTVDPDSVRDSWEGRLGESWTPPAMDPKQHRLKLEQLR